MSLVRPPIHHEINTAHDKKTYSRFTCPKIAVIFSGSFRAVLFFFFADLRRNNGF